ncbi:Metalloendoproteinase 1 [Spatholobus suberectus]|nr:Metalloendoproteinase 1 [Spatholobus suberectus]
MSLPCCGVPDIVTHHKSNSLVIPENYSFFLGSRKWTKWALAYTYTSSANRLISMDIVRQAMRSAFLKWSRVTNFTFTETGCYEPT